MKANELRVGMVIVFEGEECRVVQADHRSPGNKRAFIQARLARLKDGTQKEYKFSSQEDVEKAHLETHEMQYLYEEHGHYNFMNTENYEQISLGADQLGNGVHYLLPNSVVQITFCREKAVGLELPQAMEFEVTEAEPGMRTATASAAMKTAKIETGHAIKVPQFVEVGDKIRINPASDKYLDRVKK